MAYSDPRTERIGELLAQTIRKDEKRDERTIDERDERTFPNYGNEVDALFERRRNHPGRFCQDTRCPKFKFIWRERDQPIKTPRSHSTLHRKT
jgi:hypothetical protein